MAKKTIYHYNVTDKKVNGLWVERYQFTTDEDINVFVSRTGTLWRNMNSRCDILGWTQRENESYQGVCHLFVNYQEFAEWATSQKGVYSKNENGLHWELDKDILVFGNKVYSTKTCCFVPKYINNLLLDRLRGRGKFPLGVYWEKKRSKYRARCKDVNGKSTDLGFYLDAKEAHKQWQIAKIDMIKGRLVRYATEEMFNERVYEALIGRVKMIEKDIEFDRGTVKL